MNTNNKNIIVIAYASTGSGHKTAAEAIAKSLKKIIEENYKICFDDINIVLIDILDFFIKPIDGNSTVNAYSGTFPALYDLVWRYNFTGRLLWGGGSIWPSFPFKNLEVYFSQIKPKAVICTHMMAANISQKARQNLNQHFPIISVPTDYEIEGLWPHKETDLFCVASNKMIDTLRTRKINLQKVLLTGIPVMNKFSKKYDKNKLREKLKLPKNKTIVLILAGASESSPYESLRKILDKSFKYFIQMDWIQFVFCTGNDKNYRNSLEENIIKYSATNITTLGYINKIDQLMAASDIALTKSGGLTITECLTSGIPMILVGKAYAQESINQKFLLENNAAFHASKPKEIISILYDITNNDIMRKEIIKNSESIRQSKSAKKVALASLQMAGYNIKGNADAAYAIFKNKIKSTSNIGFYIGHKPNRKNNSI